jgi:hypothetical protein
MVDTKPHSAYKGECGNPQAVVSRAISDFLMGFDKLGRMRE